MSRLPVVEVRRLTVRYGGVVAVDDVSLEVERGSLTALVGESGCGKTTLLRTIAGFEEPVAGEVRLDGRVVAGPGTWVPPEKRQVGMVFQEGALFPHLTVGRNVLYGLSGLDDAKPRARSVLELVGLAELADRFPDELSGGQQQRVALARALAPSPRVVLLDEPFANLDATLRQRVRQEVRTILERAGATGVLVTHDQEEALSVADRVAVMQAGRILQVGSPEEVYESPGSAAVARFLGDGQLVPGRVEAGVLRSVFGEVRTDAPDGEVRLLVRPEDLVIMPPGFRRGLAGTVVDRRFFGHDLLQEVELEGGEHVAVRLLSSTAFVVGSEVRLVLRPRSLPVFSAGPEAPLVGRAEPSNAAADRTNTAG